MINNVLGLQIDRAKQGLETVLKINANKDWIEYVRDIRSDLLSIEPLDSSTAVLLLTNIKTGHLITVARHIEGRGSDYIGAWIYVPATVKISGDKLVEVIEAVKSEILAEDRDDKKLEDLFSTPYEEMPVSGMLPKCISKGEGLAFRYYGHGNTTLPGLLEKMCQPYYSNYKGVFLLDMMLKPKCKDADDLTDEPYCKVSKIKVPDSKDGFVPYINGIHVEETLCYAGEKVYIEWKKNGYKTIEEEVTVKADGTDNKITIEGPLKDKREIEVPYDKVIVQNEFGQKIEGYKLYINDKEIKEGEVIFIREREIDDVKVCVKADGYEEKIVHRSLKDKLKVNLKKDFRSEDTSEQDESQKWQFKNFMKGKKGKKEQKTRTQDEPKPEQPNPVDNDVKSGETSSDEITNNKGVKQFKFTINIRTVLTYSLVFTLGFVLAMVIYSINYKDFKSKEDIYKSHIADLESRIDTLEQRITVLEPYAKYYSEKSALDYLNKNKTWKRSEMEKYYHLKGLWDAVNTRNERIKEFEALTKESSRFKKVFDLVNRIQKGEYTKGEDIVVENFINFATKKLQGPGTPAKGKTTTSRSTNVMP